MAKYQYNGDAERSFPTLGVTVKKGDTFEGPEGLVAPGVSLVSSAKSAPAESASKEKVKVSFNPNAKDGDGDGLVQDGTIHERPVGKTTEKPSASSDMNAGA